MLIIKGSAQITLAHYRMKMVISQTGTRTRLRSLMLSLLWSSTLIMGSGTPRALSWRTMTVRMINSQLTLNLCGICYSYFLKKKREKITKREKNKTQERQSSKTQLMLSKGLSWSFLRGHGNPERSQLTGSWRTLSLFSRRSPPETAGLSVSLQCLVKSWKRLFWELLKSHGGQCSHQS